MRLRQAFPDSADNLGLTIRQIIAIYGYRIFGRADRLVPMKSHETERVCVDGISRSIAGKDIAMTLTRRIKDYAVIILAALILSLSYYIFVFPNQFAPSGMPGIATIIQELFDFQVGYLTMIINLPLLVIIYFVVGREFAGRSAAFSIVFSAALVLLDYVDLSRFVYQTTNGTSTILAPLAGGVISGFCYALVLQRNGCTGGTDLVAAWVHQSKPEYNMIWIVFIFNAIVAGLSYFVYDYNIEPVILCLMYCFISSKVGDMMLKGLQEAVKFEIVTERPQELSKALMESLHHGVTEIPAMGGFTHSNKTLLICVVNKHQIVEFQRIIHKFPGSFAYLSTVKETMGNFQRTK